MACRVKMAYQEHLDHQVTKGMWESKDMLDHKVRTVSFFFFCPFTAMKWDKQILQLHFEKNFADILG